LDACDRSWSARSHAPTPITIVATLLIARFLLIPAATQAMRDPA
jgi:hypothetical protein